MAYIDFYWSTLLIVWLLNYHICDHWTETYWPLHWAISWKGLPCGLVGNGYNMLQTFFGNQKLSCGTPSFWKAGSKEVPLNRAINLSHKWYRVLCNIPDEFASAVWSGDYGLVRRALLGDGCYNMEARDALGHTLLMHTVKHGRAISELHVIHEPVVWNTNNKNKS